MSRFVQLSRRPPINLVQIQGCDAILARMQEMLLGFQADLGGISDEIKHLQVHDSSACSGGSSRVLPRFLPWVCSLMPLDSLEGEAEASVANSPKTASGDVKELHCPNRSIRAAY